MGLPFEGKGIKSFNRWWNKKNKITVHIRQTKH